MRLTKRWERVVASCGSAFLLIATCYKVFAVPNCHSYASQREDGKASGCDDADNTNTGNYACVYRAASARIYCRTTTAETVCVSPCINPLTGTPLIYTQVIVWEIYGACVNGVCNYNVTIGGSPQNYYNVSGTCDQACPPEG